MIKNFRVKVYPDWPPKNVKYEEHQIYRELIEGSTDIDWNRLNATLENIDDFRTPALMRILYELCVEFKQRNIITPF